MDPKSDDRGEQKEFSIPRTSSLSIRSSFSKPWRMCRKPNRTFWPCWSRQSWEIPPYSTTWACGTLRGRVDSDMVQAAHWFSPGGGESGDLRAIEALGRCYQMGTGVEEDQCRAVELYTQAADQGLCRGAQCSLGLCLKKAPVWIRTRSRRRNTIFWPPSRATRPPSVIWAYAVSMASAWTATRRRPSTG